MELGAAELFAALSAAAEKELESVRAELATRAPGIETERRGARRSALEGARLTVRGPQ